MGRWEGHGNWCLATKRESCRHSTTVPMANVTFFCCHRQTSIFVFVFTFFVLWRRTIFLFKTIKHTKEWRECDDCLLVGQFPVFNCRKTDTLHSHWALNDAMWRLHRFRFFVSFLPSSYTRATKAFSRCRRHLKHSEQNLHLNSLKIRNY